MPVEPEHLYVIPPGTYLSVDAGALRLSPPEMRDGVPHGARLPFDALLHSLAGEYSRRVTCVVLSGTGSDGSAGLRAVKEAGGLVVAQDPDEADYDGMPRSASATGLVDAILSLADIPGALAAVPARHEPPVPPSAEASSPTSAAAAGSDPVSDIIALLYARNGRGTLHRRIDWRIGLASLGGDLDRYVDLLPTDASELDQLARDLLIHVTRFFRDPAVFDTLTALIPAMLQNRPPNHSVRVWIAGCSTDEEAYSIVILFCEAIEHLRCVWSSIEQERERGAMRSRSNWRRNIYVSC